LVGYESATSRLRKSVTWLRLIGRDSSARQHLNNTVKSPA